MKINLAAFLLLISFTACKTATDHPAAKSNYPESDSSLHTLAESAKLKTYTEAELDSINDSNERMVDYGNKERIHKLSIATSDSDITLGSDIHLDYRIFGYQKPDANSKKMILFSIFTTDVDSNPFNCKYGASYDLDQDSLQLKYLSKADNFVKVIITKNKRTEDTVYFEEKWTEFQNW